MVLVFLVVYWLFLMVLGDSWWLFEVLGGCRNFSAVFGGSWLFLVVQMVNLWFFVVLSDAF